MGPPESPGQVPSFLKEAQNTSEVKEFGSAASMFRLALLSRSVENIDILMLKVGFGYKSLLLTTYVPTHVNNKK